MAIRDNFEHKILNNLLISSLSNSRITSTRRSNVTIFPSSKFRITTKFKISPKNQILYLTKKFFLSQILWVLGSQCHARSQDLDLSLHTRPAAATKAVDVVVELLRSALPSCEVVEIECEYLTEIHYALIIKNTNRGANDLYDITEDMLDAVINPKGGFSSLYDNYFPRVMGQRNSDGNLVVRFEKVTPPGTPTGPQAKMKLPEEDESEEKPLVQKYFKKSSDDFPSSESGENSNAESNPETYEGAEEEWGEEEEE